MDNVKERLTELLSQISENPKYEDKLFSCSSVYFKIYDGEIYEIPTDYSETARGDGGSLATFHGPSKEQNDYMEKLMDEIGFSEYFFDDLIDEYGCYSEEDAREHFKLDAYEYFLEHGDYEFDDDEIEYDDWCEELDENEEKTAQMYLDIIERFDVEEAPFESFDDFVETLKYFGCDSDKLYYEWEGEILEFEDTLCNSMEERGTYEDFTDEEWINILENIDDHIE